MSASGAANMLNNSHMEPMSAATENEGSAAVVTRGSAAAGGAEKRLTRNELRKRQRQE